MHLNKLLYHTLPWHIGIINNQLSPPSCLCFAKYGDGNKKYTIDGLMVKESLSATHRHDLESDCELLWLEILYLGRGLLVPLNFNDLTNCFEFTKITWLYNYCSFYLIHSAYVRS